MSEKSYTINEILNELDKNRESLVIDLGYIYPATVRLHAYQNDLYWLIIMQLLGYHYKLQGHESMNLNTFIFGNCIKKSGFLPNYDYGQSIKNEYIPYYEVKNNQYGPIITDLLTQDEADPTFFCTNNGGEEIVNPAAKYILIRDQKVSICHDQAFYESKHIQLEEYPKIKNFEFLRSLVPEYKNLLLNTDKELSKIVPPGLTKMLTLDEWYHPDIFSGDIPSKNETFQLIADVLVSKNKNSYQPTKQPNTHWSNWPKGGTL